MFGRYGTLTPEEESDIKVFLSYTPYALIHYQLLTISDQAYPRDILPIAEEALIECAFCRKIGGYRCLTEAAAKVCPDTPKPIYKNDGENDAVQSEVESPEARR